MNFDQQFKPFIHPGFCAQASLSEAKAFRPEFPKGYQDDT